MRGTNVPRGVVGKVTVLIAAWAITATACTTAPANPAIAPSPEPVTESPTSTPASSAEVGATAVPADVMEPGPFWNYIGGVDQVESYDSLDSIIRASDLVALVGVTEFREGRQIDFPETGETMYMAEVRVQSGETLHGDAISPPDAPGSIVVETSYGFSPNPARLAALAASTPIGSSVVLFLVNKAADAERHGFPADAPFVGEDYHYLLLRGDQAAIRDEDGIARIGPGEDPAAWVEDLDGRSFEEVVQKIREAPSR